MIPKSGAFPLQKVLEIRKHLEDMQAIKLGKVQGEKIEADARLQGLKENKEKIMESATEEMNANKTVDLKQMKIQRDYLEHLNGKISSQVHEIRKLEKEIEQKRQELKEAMKERKIVEKLKERFQERKKMEIIRKENQKTDEVAIRMSVMRGKEGV